MPRRETGDRLSVIILPTGEIGRRLREVLTIWTKSGLLAPSLLIEPDQVTISGPAAPTVPAWHLGPWGADQDQLFEVVSRRKRRLVRVVVAQVLAEAAGVDLNQLMVADAILAAVRDSVPAPLRHDQEAYSGTGVLSLNVIAGVTGLSCLPPETIREKWHVNVVVSPEDRRDPSRASVFVRHPGNLVPVAAATIATVSGLFAGAEEGAFDRSRADPSSAFGKVVVLRTTVRALMMDRVVEDIARESVLDALESGSPAISEPENCAIAARPDDLIERAVEWAEDADHAGLGFNPGTTREHDARVRVTLVQGVLAFLRFSASALGSIVLDLYGSVVRGAERVATLAITGADSGFEITLRPSVTRALGGQVMSSDAEDRARTARQIVTAGRIVPAGPTAALWSSLRCMVFGLLDGVGYPDDFTAPKDGNRRLVLRGPKAIVPHPTLEHVVSADAVRLCALSSEQPVVIESMDVDAYLDVHHAVSAARSVLTAELAALDDRLADVAATLALANQRGDDAKSSELHLKLAALTERRAVAAQELGILDDEFDKLIRWYGRRSHSFLWLLRARVVRRIRDASEREAQIRLLVAAEANIDPNEPHRRHRRFLGLFLAWAAGIAITGYLMLGHRLPWKHFALTPNAIGWSVWSAVACLLLILVLRDYYQGVLSFLRRFATSLEDRQAATDELIVVMRERQRLDLVDDQLGAWSLVYGWCLHEPWSDDIPRTESLDTAVDTDSLPAGMRLAESRLDDEDDRRRAVRIGVQALTRPGWRERSFASLLLTCDTGPASDLAGALSRLDNDADRDIGPLQSFRGALQSRRPQRAVVAGALRRAEDELRARQLGRAHLTVTLDRPDPHEHNDVSSDCFLEQLLVPASPLARETWTPEALVHGHHEHTRTMLWVPKQLIGRTLPEAQVIEMEGLESSDRTVGDIAVRVDLTGPIQVSSLRLFAVPEGRPEPSPIERKLDDIFL